MLKIKNLSLAAVSAMVLLSACSKEPSFKTSDNGVEYYFYEDKEGPVAKQGDIVTLNFLFKTNKDSVLRNTWKEGRPIPIMVQPSTFKGGFEDGLQMLSVGDSAAFKINADSLFLKTFGAPRPAFIDSGSYLTFQVKVLKIQNKEEYEKDQMAEMETRKKEIEQKMSGQKAVDDSLIKAFIASKNISASKTESGLYYSITQNGKGPKVQKDKLITVHYTGKLLDGTVFDSSEGREPIEFMLGAGQVIPGWDEGLSLLNVGSKATLIIPSGLGYGPMPNGKIPAFSVLVFDVEVVKAGK